MGNDELGGMFGGGSLTARYFPRSRMREPSFPEERISTTVIFRVDDQLGDPVFVERFGRVLDQLRVPPGETLGLGGLPGSGCDSLGP